MQFTYRPLAVWPHPVTQDRRNGQFQVGWQRTLEDLEYEIGRLDGRNVIFGVGLEERDIRLDGLPRANARPLRHPGIEISFDSRYGRLTYATDAFHDWRDNLRAIALGLEALRAVDRYGISRRGEQYAGYAQLTAGGPDAERGRKLVERLGSIAAALRATHPDTRTDDYTDLDFADVQAYRQNVEPRLAAGSRQ